MPMSESIAVLEFPRWGTEMFVHDVTRVSSAFRNRHARLEACLPPASGSLEPRFARGLLRIEASRDVRAVR